MIDALWALGHRLRWEGVASPFEHVRRAHEYADLDRATDSYDRVRFYQYPFDDTLVITDLETKKWRRKKIVF